MLSLYSEIIVSIISASFLGLFAGWMIQKSLSKRKLLGTIATWEDRLKESEDNARRDSEHLEDQLQSLGDEVKSLNETNRVLKSNIQDNENEVHQTRSDAIELNRQQSEAQERLQRIIQEKEQKIAELDKQPLDTDSDIAAASTTLAATVAVPSTIDDEFADSMASYRSKLANKKYDDELDNTATADFHNNQTVSVEDQTEVINTGARQGFEPESDHTETTALPNTMTETLDDTARLGTTSSHQIVSTLPEDPFDATLDATAELVDSSLDIEEATVALDEEALRFAKSPRRRD